MMIGEARSRPDALAGVRAVLAGIGAAELDAASAVLGIGRTELLDYPDGRLDRIPLDDLAGHVRRFARTVRPSHLLTFDSGGITGHPDHVHATRAALLAAGRLGLPVLGWTIPQEVAETLNAEFGAGFTGRDTRRAGRRIAVDRTRQYRAIRCHRNQATGNPVLYRRLALMGGTEHARLLRPAFGTATDTDAPGQGGHTPSGPHADTEREVPWNTA
jgi:LmbE family N-acetylglucosaminyl deacetylase